MSNENRVLEVRTSQGEPEREPSDFVLRASQIWLLFAVLEVLISLRIGLKQEKMAYFFHHRQRSHTNQPGGFWTKLAGAAGISTIFPPGRISGGVASVRL